MLRKRVGPTSMALPRPRPASQSRRQGWRGQHPSPPADPPQPAGAGSGGESALKGNNMRVQTAVIPAAGLGTRFLPASKAVPKEMLPIIDKPVIEYVVDEAVASGIDKVVVITSQWKRAIE